MTNLAEGFMLISEQEKSGKVGDVKTSDAKLFLLYYTFFHPAAALSKTALRPKFLHLLLFLISPVLISA